MRYSMSMAPESSIACHRHAMLGPHRGGDGAGRTARASRRGFDWALRELSPRAARGDGARLRVLPLREGGHGPALSQVSTAPRRPLRGLRGGRGELTSRVKGGSDARSLRRAEHRIVRAVDERLRALGGKLLGEVLRG